MVITMMMSPCIPICQQHGCMYMSGTEFGKPSKGCPHLKRSHNVTRCGALVSHSYHLQHAVQRAHSLLTALQCNSAMCLASHSQYQCISTTLLLLLKSCWLWHACPGVALDACCGQHWWWWAQEDHKDSTIAHPMLLTHREPRESATSSKPAYSECEAAACDVADLAR